MEENFSDVVNVVLKSKMAATSNQKDENNQILYDLLVQAEWQLEAEPLVNMSDIVYNVKEEVNANWNSLMKATLNLF